MSAIARRFDSAPKSFKYRSLPEVSRDFAEFSRLLTALRKRFYTQSYVRDLVWRNTTHVSNSVIFLSFCAFPPFMLSFLYSFFLLSLCFPRFLLSSSFLFLFRFLSIFSFRFSFLSFFFSLLLHFSFWLEFFSLKLFIYVQHSIVCLVSEIVAFSGSW